MDWIEDPLCHAVRYWGCTEESPVSQTDSEVWRDILLRRSLSMPKLPSHRLGIPLKWSISGLGNAGNRITKLTWLPT